MWISSGSSTGTRRILCLKEQFAKFSTSSPHSPDICALPTQPKRAMNCGKHSSAALAELPERDAELGFIELRITQGYMTI